MTTQTPATAELKSDSRSGSGFSRIFDSGSERKTQSPAGVESRTLDPVPPLVVGVLSMHASSGPRKVAFSICGKSATKKVPPV